MVTLPVHFRHQYVLVFKDTLCDYYYLFIFLKYIFIFNCHPFCFVFLNNKHLKQNNRCVSPTKTLHLGQHRIKRKPSVHVMYFNLCFCLFAFVLFSCTHFARFFFLSSSLFFKVIQHPKFIND